MTHSFTYAAAIASVAAALALAQAKPVLAKDASPGATTIKKSEASKRHKRRAAQTGAPARPAWTGADPTKGPGVDMIRKMQAEGRCIMDEGYGRWSACSDR
jgi:hypothetical protein